VYRLDKGSRPTFDRVMRGLRLLQKHEFDYVAGTEKALDAVQTHGWSIVSMQRDWRTIFASAT